MFWHMGSLQVTVHASGVCRVWRLSGVYGYPKGHFEKASLGPVSKDNDHYGETKFFVGMQHGTGLKCREASRP